MAMLDAFADRAHAAEPGAEDVLRFRSAIAAECPALGLIAEVCALRADGPRLAVQAFALEAKDYRHLPVEDYMVSLYSGGTVQRVMVVSKDGERLAHEVIDEAMAWWRERLRQPRSLP